MDSGKRTDTGRILAPYRQKIDALDRQIVELLSQRYAVIREVGHLKFNEKIDSVLQDRVDEVRENAAKLAAEKGIDADFIRTLYAQLIEHSCNLEETIIQELSRTGKKTASR